MSVYQRAGSKIWYASIDVDAAGFVIFAKTDAARRKKIGEFHTRNEAEKVLARMLKEGDTRSFVIEEGTRGRRSLGSFKTKDEARKAEREAMTAHDKGTTIAAGVVTVADIIDRYNSAREEMGRELKTTTEYRRQARLYIIPYLGTQNVAKLKPVQVSEWLSTLRRSGGSGGERLSAKSVNHAYRLLSAALRWAVRLELIGRNVCTSVDPPPIPKSAANAFSNAEVDKIITTAAGTRWEAFIVVGLAIGARRAELLALNWSDVNLTDQKVTINKAMSQITGSRPFVKGTKTGSIRTVPLAEIAIDAIRRHRTRQKEERLAAGPAYRADPTEPIFTNEFGERLTPQAATTAFHDIAESAKVSSTRLHDLRHTTASYLLANGVDIKTVSAILGQANASVTLNVYAHMLEGGMRAAIGVLGTSLEKTRGAGLK